MLEKYPFVRELGGGGFGWVFLARHAQTGQEVAVKLLRAGDDDQRQRFARELRILREQVDNRYVVNVLDADLNHVPPYIVLEYCDGGSLRDWVTNRKEWAVVATAMLHATLGIRDLHLGGGFHRDVKPDNLLIGKHGKDRVVKVADFGVARTPTTVQGTMTRTPWGTEGYVAPELRAGAPCTAAADVFSLGVTGIELLTGSTNPQALSSAHAPPTLIQLLQRMVAATPSERPTIQDVAQSLQALFVPQPAPPPKQPAPAPASGSGWGAFLAVAGLAAAVAALVANDSAKWDANVGRYRGSDGRFR